jgi:hypothetical protein
MISDMDHFLESWENGSSGSDMEEKGQLSLLKAQCQEKYGIKKSPYKRHKKSIIITLKLNFKGKDTVREGGGTEER